MRTTLSIEDDLAASIEKRRVRENLSLREVIDGLLRAGLQATERQSSSKPFNGPVFDGELKPGIDPLRLNQLADELEVEEFVS